MNQYPNQEQGPNQPQGQYPTQGEHTQYPPPGYGAPSTPPYSGQEQQQVYQQPPYQQGGYQQQPYQQGGYQQQFYGQSPYQQSPYPQAPAISFDYRNIIAGVGAIVALIAFFLPFYTYGISTYSSSSSGVQLGGKYWLDFIIALVGLGIVALLQFNEQLLKTATSPMLQRVRTSLTTQTKTWYVALITTGGFGIFFHFILDLGVLSSWGVGSWLFLLGLIAIVVGGVLFIRPPAPSPFQNPPGGPVPPIQ